MKTLLRPIAKKIRQFYYQTFVPTTWDSGISHEVVFWDKYFKTEGLDWPEDYQQRLDPQMPLSSYHRQFIDDLSIETVRILDVGAGPLTVVGKVHPHKTLDITATDALAPQYDQILAKYQITPPVRTQFAKAEALSQYFPKNSFDFVYAQNCIDHCEDPFLCISEMLALVKPGHYVALRHHENEAESEGYVGFHQWNFSMQDDHFLITGRSVKHDVSAELSHLAEISCTREGQDVLVVFRKL